ncbi:histone-lysine N-methyltransferase SETMAR [Trichonephila clavipes]|nr:histone-lysine N-methyltransferase SETMAR [Trichonephila clavipes]
MEWRHTSSPVKVKAKQMLFKIMATVFWDRSGVLMMNFMPQETRVNSSAYCETLRKLQRALQNKRRDDQVMKWLADSIIEPLSSGFSNQVDDTKER